MHRLLAMRQPLRLLLAAGAFSCAVLPLSGCTVIAVAGTAVSVTASAVGLAADAAIGTAKIVGKGVGKAADALMDDKAPDNSGVNVRYRDAAAAPHQPPGTAPGTTSSTAPNAGGIPASAGL